MTDKTKLVLEAAGYKKDPQFRCEKSDTTQQFTWKHADGSFYVVTSIINWTGSGKNRRATEAAVKSWFYRGLGGNAKSEGKWWPEWHDEHEASLIKHVRGNKKKTPKTKIRRRSSDEIRRANFVTYD